MSADLKDIARNDQAMTELNDTIGRVCIAYKMLLNVGIPEPSAASMVAEFNRRLFNRHFNVQMLETGMDFIDADMGMEDEP